MPATRQSQRQDGNDVSTQIVEPSITESAREQPEQVSTVVQESETSISTQVQRESTSKQTQLVPVGFSLSVTFKISSGAVPKLLPKPLP
jgi:hypothetical protein